MKNGINTLWEFCIKTRVVIQLYIKTAVIIVFVFAIHACAGNKVTNAAAPILQADRIFYIDSVSGSDSNSGMSESAAWQNISKVNDYDFSAGDSVLFKRGCEFSGNIIINDSGTAGKTLKISAYGTGEKPKINALVGSPGIKIDNADYLIIEGIEITGGSQCVFAVNSPSGGEITLKDLTVHEPESLNCIAVRDRPNVNIIDCEVYGAPLEKGISVYDSDITEWNSYPCLNIKIQNCHIYNNYESGVYLRGHSGFIEGNNIHNNGIETGAHNIYLIGDNHIVRSNVLAQSPAGDGIRYEGSNIKFSRNFVNANISHGISIHNDFPHTLTDNEFFSNIVIQGNAVNYGFKITTSGGEVSGVKFYNNTVYGPHIGNTGAGLFGCSDIEVVNNIFYSGYDTLYYGYDVLNKGLISDYNCLYSLKSDGSHILNPVTAAHVTFSAWQALGYDTQSTNAAPFFVSAAPTLPDDLKLSSGSPCVDSGSETLLYADYFGNTASGARDIGAAEKY